MTLFYNATFHTLENIKARAISVNEDGIIDKIFTSEPNLDNFSEKIDLQNSHVLPGFIDTHTHSFEGGLYSLSKDLSASKNISELLKSLKKTDSFGNKIFAYNFDENTITEKRFPTISELDTVSKKKAIILRRVDGHSCCINSFAKNLLEKKITFPKDFNGILKKKDNDIAVHYFHKSLDNLTIKKAFKNAEKIGLKNGITTIHTMIGDAQDDLLYYNFIKDIDFTIDWVFYPQILNIEKALSVNKKRIGGCILADGSFGSFTAALKENYLNKKNCFGEKYQTDKFWINFVKEAHKNNLQVAVHAIGDAAIEQILTAYEKAQNNNPKDLRHQIIHCELISDKMIERMEKANVTAVMQPMFDKLWGGKGNFYEKILGSERIKKLNRLNSLTKNNVLVSGSSDWYITELNPLKGISAAEKIHNPKERLSRKEAIKLYTKNAAFVSHDEEKIGTLKKNKFADMVCLDKNPFEIKNFADLKILKTIKKGKICNTNF